MQKWFITTNGSLVSLDGAQPEANWVEVSGPRTHPLHVWLGSSWGFTKSGLKAFAADKRYRMETGGTTLWDVVPVKTDRESQGLINGAFNLTQVQPGLLIKYAGVDGFITLDAATVKVLAETIGIHVQKAFAAQEGIETLISAGKITSVDQIENWSGWYE